MANCVGLPGISGLLAIEVKVQTNGKIAFLVIPLTVASLKISDPCRARELRAAYKVKMGDLVSC